jgi:hypothetical protein
MVLIKVRKEETRRVEKATLRMMDFRRGDRVAEVAGIEGEEGVAIGPGEAAVGELSLFCFIFYLINILIL